jgi:hypothetical protein
MPDEISGSVAPPLIHIAPASRHRVAALLPHALAIANAMELRCAFYWGKRRPKLHTQERANIADKPLKRWTALLQMIASTTTILAHLNEDDAGAGAVRTITVTPPSVQSVARNRSRACSRS